MSSIPAVIAGVVLICATPAQASAAQSESAKATAEMQAAVERPPTPAAVVLLLPHAAEPAAVARLVAALRDPNPEVRAVAARVAFTTRHQEMLPALLAALETETATVAAAELVRAIALIAGPAADAAVFRVVPRHTGAVKDAWLEVVGRTRPADALSRLPQLGDRTAAVLNGLSSVDGVLLGQAFAQLGQTPALESAYAALLGQARRPELVLPWGAFAPGLRASAAIRREVVHVLLGRQADGSSLPPEAAAALDELRAVPRPTEDPWLTMALELARRPERPGQPAVPLTPAIAAFDPSAAPEDWRRDGFLRRLDPAEEAALRARVTDLPAREVWGSEPAALAPAVAPPAVAEATSETTTRLVRPLTPGLVAELGAMTGCKPAAGQVLAAEVAYRPTGQVRHVSAPVGGGVGRCGLAARLLAAIDVAPGADALPATRSDLVMVGFRPEDATCPRVVMRGSGDAARVDGGAVRAPRKVRNVQPVYPQAMQDGRVQGVVVVEAVIAPTGCVADAVVLSGPHLALKAAGLAAVSAWQYEPTRLDGEAVPVIMVVTVNFRLF